jgi:hypothetical protein
MERGNGEVKEKGRSSLVSPKYRQRIEKQAKFATPYTEAKVGV